MSYIRSSDWTSFHGQEDNETTRKWSGFDTPCFLRRVIVNLLWVLANPWQGNLALTLCFRWWPLDCERNMRTTARSPKGNQVDKPCEVLPRALGFLYKETSEINKRQRTGFDSPCFLKEVFVDLFVKLYNRVSQPPATQPSLLAPRRR